MASFVSWIYNTVFSDTRNENTRTEEQDSVAEESFVNISSSDVQESLENIETVNRCAREIYFSKSLGETCRQELEDPSSLTFKDNHFENRPTVGLKVNTKKGKRKKTDTAEIGEKVATDPPEDNLTIKAKPTEESASKKQGSSKNVEGSAEVVEARKKSPTIGKKTSLKSNQKIKTENLAQSSIILHYQKTEKVKKNKSVKTSEKQQERNTVPAIESEGVLSEETSTNSEEVVALESQVVTVKEPISSESSTDSKSSKEEDKTEVVDSKEVAEGVVNSTTDITEHLEEPSTLQVISTSETETVNPIETGAKSEHFEQTELNDEIIDRTVITDRREISEGEVRNQVLESEPRLLEESSAPQTGIVNQIKIEAKNEHFEQTELNDEIIERTVITDRREISEGEVQNLPLESETRLLEDHSTLETSETEIVDQTETEEILGFETSEVDTNNSIETSITENESYLKESIDEKPPVKYTETEFEAKESSTDSETNNSGDNKKRKGKKHLTKFDKKNKSVSVEELVRYFEGSSENKKLENRSVVDSETSYGDSTTDFLTSEPDQKNSEETEELDSFTTATVEQSAEVIPSENLPKGTEQPVSVESASEPAVEQKYQFILPQTPSSDGNTALDDLSTFVNVSSDSTDEYSADELSSEDKGQNLQSAAIQTSETDQADTPEVQTIISLTINISSVENTQSVVTEVSETDLATVPADKPSEQTTTNTTDNNENQPEDQPKIATINTGESENNTNKPTTTMEANREIRVLTLNANEHQDTVLYRIEQNWIIQFRLGPSLLGHKVVLFCNYPQINQEFQRDHYYELEWMQDEGCSHVDDTAMYAQIVARISGSFYFYFTYLNENSEGKPQGSGYFLVDPILRYGENEILPLDCIQCQTVLVKSLGRFSTWANKLRVAKESGYNMIHFTPIQELGGSKSSYCLSEQLKLNPTFSYGNDAPVTFEDIERFIVKLRKEWKVASICDIVLNHTANESTWLKTHPEATYNCNNCRYLRPAYLLDAAFHQFSHDVKKGVYENKGIPPEVNSEEHLNAIRYAFQTEVLPVIRIHELFICDANKLGAEFLSLARRSPPRTAKPGDVTEELDLIQDQEFKRLGCTIDMELALKIYNVYRLDCFDEETRIKRCGEDFKKKLDALNEAVIVKISQHLSAALENVIGGIHYNRIQSDGPRIKEISVKNPLISRYFTDYGNPLTFNEHEEIMYSENGTFLMAHNGWIINGDSLRNFAASDSNVYLRRELIAWGDSVKLRYGEKPDDSPFLWEHMRAYVEQTARIFDGVRLDNCHSTPIVVAEYLLDCARKIRPDLYVVAELFTNKDHTDNIFVNRLGITSLIREAMSAGNSHEEGRLVYRYGGYPVGSFMQPRLRPLVPTVAHALFLDLTHDNPSPVEKRSIFDLLPSSALVNMASCASGSNRGYDELVPHHIHVVDETRQYAEWSDDERLLENNQRYVGINSGIIAAKRALNNLHLFLGQNGFNQVYVDQMDPDVVAVTRHNPESHESFVLVAFTAFGHPDLNAAGYQRDLKPLRVEGVVEEIILEATLSHIGVRDGASKYTRFENFEKDERYINGVKEYFVEVREHIPVVDSQMLERVDSGTANVTQLNFKNFKPGSVVAIRVLQPESVRNAILKLRQVISTFSQTNPTELRNVISKLKLEDLNHALYRCDQEEKDGGNGFDVYNVPNYGSLVYAGFQGFLSLLANIRPINDVGHPMCANLRDGDWMIDYIWQRLKVYEGTKELGEWIEENTKPLKQIPRYLVPSYFDVLVTGIYIDLVEQCYKGMSEFVSRGSTFVRSLALGSVQMGGIINSSRLPTLSPALADPKPTIKNNEQVTVTLSAGLPHFSNGYMRNWGRDTFIAVRGLFILTGRHQEARYHILGYAACLRHGLIPNLLDGGNNPRYNCRDAIWWWLHSIKSYVEEVPNGVSILQDVVSRIFPTDESENKPAGAVEQPLHQVMQEGLNVHFQGLAFRERNAGQQIDAHMIDQGFNNQIGIHPETGFVFGGNEWNCGTWMDKMGSSDKAGIRGKPATPRDGSAIELIGLSKAVISWLAELNNKKLYPYDGVERTQKNGKKIKWTFQEWAEKIQINFEKYFWVNTEPVQGELRLDLVNKRGIYKDCYGATQAWSDYQLRCNFPIAMVVAPELFDPKHAWTALQQAEEYLLGPLGMKTLDPEDWAYRGDYDNSNDSGDPSVAHGINYHQGPEWVWPLGFYLRAKLIFASANNALEKTVANTKIVLSKHFTELQTSPWRGLPELTNKDGAYCRDSCRTQAWSMSCVLEVLADLQKIEARSN